MRNLNFFRYSCKISTNENTILLKSRLSIFTSPVKIVSAWNIVLSSLYQIFTKKFSEIKQKRMLNFFLTFHMILKIFFQNYSLNIINAHQLLAERLQGREQGLGESSGLSHSLGRRCGDWWGVVTASHA